MVFDVQCTYPQQLIKITAVSLLPDEEVPTAEIVGDDFSAVDSVLLNDIPSPKVIVLSKTTLTAELPPEVQGQSLINVSVVSYQLVYTQRSVVSFRLGATNRKTRGINRLIQLFLKILLTTPGSDIFSPKLGGGAMRSLGRTFSKSESGNIVSDIVVAVDNTAKQITAIQARQPRIPRDERLLSAKVTGAQFDTTQTALVVSVLLTSQSGVTGMAQLTL